MKKKLLLLTTLLTTWMCGSIVANTCDLMNTGFYISGKLGPAFLTQVEYEADFENDVFKERTKSHVGFFGSGALGYKFCNNLRLEGEVAYRHFSFGRLKFEDETQTQKVTLKPSIDVLNYMANVYYDMNFGYPLMPYIGAGIGYMDTSCSVHARDAERNSVKVKVNSGEFAWQWMAGLNYKVCKNVDLMAEYRMMQNEKNNVLSFGLRRYL